MEDYSKALKATAKAAQLAGVTKEEMEALFRATGRTREAAFPAAVFGADLRAAWAIRTWRELPWCTRLWEWVRP